jgi:hypothetical protein
MWIMSIFLLFLSAPQVFPKFLLSLIPVKTEVSDFANRTYPVTKTGQSGFGYRICPAYTPDSSKPHQTYPAISLV